MRFGGKWFKYLIKFAFVCHLIGNFAISCGMVYVSRLNYPGAFALFRLHEIVPNDSEVRVHIDDFSAQSGVTRFLEMNRLKHNWSYHKTENLSPYSQEMRSFTHLLVEATNDNDALKYYKDDFKILDSLKSFNRIVWTIPTIERPIPFYVKVQTNIYILGRI
jgi:alpha-1,6-mannosyltransferase